MLLASGVGVSAGATEGYGRLRKAAAVTGAISSRLAVLLLLSDFGRLSPMNVACYKVRPDEKVIAARLQSG